jgi:hypothetical protein
MPGWSNNRIHTNRRPVLPFGYARFFGRQIRSQRLFPTAVGDPSRWAGFAQRLPDGGVTVFRSSRAGLDRKILDRDMNSKDSHFPVINFPVHCPWIRWVPAGSESCHSPPDL